jgi:putative component of membrane protein insertase Oxa1/YidC/SpoIIIJ protein YidD
MSIIKGRKGKVFVLNYFRYFIVLILLGSLFYTYTITIESSTLKAAIDKKLPIHIDKKGFLLTLNDIEILDISNHVVSSKINADIKVSSSNKFAKFLPKKSMHMNIHTQTIPKLHGTSLSFELLSFKMNKIIKIKEVKGLLKEKIENIKIPIKKLKHISWFSSVKEMYFTNSGDLILDLVVSKWLVLLLLPLFLLREVGLLFIWIYQKFISPRKKYKCAKGELYQNGTCSSTTKEAFKKDGFIAGMKEYRRSTRECKEAYKTLKKEKHRDGTSCDGDYCSVCGSGSCGGSDALGSSASACEIGGALPCEVGSC